MELKKTPLFSQHHALKARMAPFAGYEMPISYDQHTGGMSKEHLAVRTNVGMFDVCHMGEFWVRGKQALEFLNFVCTRSFAKLAENRAQYALLLNEKGTIIDDIIVYKFNSENFWMVVNASNIQKDFSHLQEQSQKFDVKLEDVSENTGLIAIQGPRAVDVMEKIYPGCSQLKYYSFDRRGDVIIARTGYTGEDGFEVFLPSSQVEPLWARLSDEKVVPIGLGARDTLRLEVGFPLYGHELSDELFPHETLAFFAVNPAHRFLGCESLQLPARFRPVSLVSENPKPMRMDEKILWEGREVGRITSGSTSPVRRLGIGLGLLDLRQLPPEAAKAKVFMLETGGKQRQSFSQDLPFVATARVKASKASGSINKVA